VKVPGIEAIDVATQREINEARPGVHRF